MKKLRAFLLTIILCFTVLTLSSCKKSKTITVCASDIPHAEILEECVAPILKEKGYELKVTVLDWTMQNDGVANKDYDCNYFQHRPYLNDYNANNEIDLVAVCAVHYEPLGIYYGKAVKTSVGNGSYSICDDPSNGVRALELLVAKGVINKTTEGTNYPITVNSDTGNSEFNFTGSTWTSRDGNVTVKLIAENFLASTMGDYDYAVLPCNTALTGNISSNRQVAKEDDPDQVSLKANVLAARESDYLNDSEYKAKIDALADVLLSSAVSSYVLEKYNGVITCDSSSQIDLRD